MFPTCSSCTQGCRGSLVFRQRQGALKFIAIIAGINCLFSLLLLLFKLKIANYSINCTLFDGTNASVVMYNLRKKDIADLINVCLLFLLRKYFFNEKTGVGHL